MKFIEKDRLMFRKIHKFQSKVQYMREYYAARKLMATRLKMSHYPHVDIIENYACIAL